MTPSQVSSQLYLISSKIDNSQSPNKNLIITDLEQLINKISTNRSEKIVKPTGDIFWYLNRKLHREDGPAIEWADGTKEWYLNGKRHRGNGPAIEWNNGSKEWYQNGIVHREDGPAVDFSNGQREWRKKGRLHREDGPAFIHPDGGIEYYINGNRLSEKEFKDYLMRRKFARASIELATNDADILNQEPDETNIYGAKVWKLNGNREFKIGPNGSKYWYKNGQYHREDGPAIEFEDGTKEWYLNGKCHREGGPAVEYANGTKLWYLNGKLHREDGPAIEKNGGEVEYWLNDQRIKTKFNDFNSLTFQKRWQKLLELERIRQVMED